MPKAHHNVNLIIKFFVRTCPAFEPNIYVLQFKRTGPPDRFQIFWQKFVDLGLNKDDAGFWSQAYVVTQSLLNTKVWSKLTIEEE